jgi:hypothetical protein
MNRHPFSWSSLAFGAFFLAVVGNWAVWTQDLLTPRQLSLTVSVLLILLGLLGVAATLWRPRQHIEDAPDTGDATGAAPTVHLTKHPEGTAHEEAHPQP